MTNRYEVIKTNHEDNNRVSVSLSTNDLTRAVNTVSADREDGDGSYSYYIQDTQAGRKVTLGDLKRAGIRS